MNADDGIIPQLKRRPCSRLVNRAGPNAPEQLGPGNSELIGRQWDLDVNLA
jgi:hypothetical protein